VALIRRHGAKSLILVCIVGLPLLAVLSLIVALVSPSKRSLPAVTFHESQIQSQQSDVGAQSRYSLNYNNSTAVSPTVRSHPEATMVSQHATPLPVVFLVAAMLGVAVLIGVSVFLAGQGGSLRLRDVGAKFASLIWIIPALVAVAFPLWRSGVLISQTSTRTPPVFAHTPIIENASLRTDEGIAAVEISAENFGETGLLHTSNVPAWVNEEPHRVGDAQFLVVSGGFSAAVDESERQQAIALSESQANVSAMTQVRNYISQGYSTWVETPQLESITRSAYEKTFLESRDKEFGRVYRQHVLLKLSPELREMYYPFWKNAAANHRLVALGTIVGMITLLLGTMTAYLRLDQMTVGAYRGRLKLASLSLITAGAILTVLVCERLGV